MQNLNAPTIAERYILGLREFRPRPGELAAPSVGDFIPRRLTEDLPPFEVEMIGVNEYQCKITLGELQDNVSASSIRTGSTFDIHDQSGFGKFPHDMTFGILFPSTDMPFSDHFTSTDHNDTRTPDFIHYDVTTNSYFISEVTTSRSGSMRAMNGAFKEKLGKYASMIEKRLQKGKLNSTAGILYNVIVCSEAGILSNYPLHHDIVEELTYRYRLAIMITDYLRIEKQWVHPTLQLSDTEVTIDGQISSIKFDVQPPGKLQPSLKESAYQDLDPEEERKVISYVFTKCAEDHTEGLNTPSPNPWDMMSGELLKNEANGIVYRQEPHWFNYPMFFCKRGSSDFDQPILYAGSHPMVEFWESAIWSYHSLVKTKTISDEEHIYMAKRGETVGDIHKEHDKRKTFRVFPKMDNPIFHAKYGLGAKQLRDHAEIREKRKISQQPIWSDNPMELNVWLEENMGKLLSESDTPKDWLLIDAADDLAGNYNCQVKDTYKDMTTTKVCEWAEVWSRIGIELSISIKQTTSKDNEFICKPIRGYPIMLICKPTKASSHLFYSIMIDRKFCESLGHPIFKGMVETEYYYISVWNSVQIDRLQNLINLPHNFTNSYFTFMTHSSVTNPINIFAKWRKDEQSYMHAMYCLLLSLENKSATEEIVTMSRYSYMEMFTLPSFHKRPEKMMAKLDFRPRSRLQHSLTENFVWLCERIQSTPLSVVAPLGLPEDADIEDPNYITTDEYKGFYSLFTRKPILKFQNVLNIVYSAYFVDKCKKAEGNHGMKLGKKIGKCEDKMAEARPECFGYSSEVDLNLHEYNLTAVKMGVQALDAHLKGLYGEHYKEHIATQFVNRLANTTLADLATIKATCIDTPQKTPYPSKDKNVNFEKARRSKLIIEIIKKIEGGELTEPAPFTKLRSLLDEANDMGMVIDLFSKSQHAGLREIYVLHITSRMVQFPIETLARVICEHVPSEAMTHPNEKPLFVSDFVNELKKMKEGGDQRDVHLRARCDDAQTWSQTHHVSKFAILLMGVTPERYHDYILKTLNLWIGRKVKMPADMVNTFMNCDPNLQMKDPIYQRMFDLFRGTEKAKWIEPGCHWMTLEGGMMQGILHYLSSLFHVSLQLVTAALVKAHVLANVPRGSRLLYCHQTTSDDSGVQVALVMPKGENARAVHALNVAMNAKIHLSTLFAIYNSPKSMNRPMRIYEFNSVFFSAAGRLNPYIRWVAASLVIIDQESLIGRLESYSNLRRQLLEGGAPIMLVRAVILAQAEQHYKMLGSTVNPTWNEFQQLINLSPDPSYGFFPMDPQYMTGAVPFHYNHWLICSTHALGLDYYEEMTQDELDVHPGGRALKYTCLRYANVRRYKEIIQGLEVDLDWRQHLEDNPEILIMGPRTVVDIVSVIMDKLYAPGVAASLMSSAATARMIASSVYLLNTPCLTTRKYLMDDITGKQKMERSGLKSLITILVERRYSNARLDVEQISRIFPFHASYEELKHFADLSHTLQKQIWPTMRRVRTKLKILENPRGMIHSLWDSCLAVWGYKELRTPMEFVVREFNDYALVYRWLRGSIYESQAESPYASRVQMLKFLQREEKQAKFLSVSGVAKCSNIQDFCRKAQWPNILLSGGSRKVQMPDRVHRTLVTHCMALAMQCRFLYLRNPNPDYTLISTIKALIHSLGFDRVDALSKGTERDKALMLICKYVLGLFSNQEFIARLAREKRGIIGGFTARQPPNIQPRVPGLRADRKPTDVRYTGQGVWEGTIGSVNIRLDASGSELRHITVESINKLRSILAPLRSLIREFGLTIGVTSGGFRRDNFAVLTDTYNIGYTPNDKGARITLEQTRGAEFMHTTNLSVVATRHSLRVVAEKVPMFGREISVTILQWTPRPFHVMERSMLPEEDWLPPDLYVAIKKWLMMENLTGAEGRYFYDIIYTENEPESLDWFKSLCKSSAIHKNWIVRYKRRIERPVLFEPVSPGKKLKLSVNTKINMDDDEWEKYADQFDFDSSDSEEGALNVSADSAADSLVSVSSLGPALPDPPPFDTVPGQYPLVVDDQRPGPSYVTKESIEPTPWVDLETDSSQSEKSKLSTVSYIDDDAFTPFIWRFDEPAFDDIEETWEHAAMRPSYMLEFITELDASTDGALSSALINGRTRSQEIADLVFDITGDRVRVIDVPVLDLRPRVRPRPSKRGH